MTTFLSLRGRLGHDVLINVDRIVCVEPRPCEMQTFATITMEGGKAVQIDEQIETVRRVIREAEAVSSP
jgi:hypothetical protein